MGPMRHFVDPLLVSDVAGQYSLKTRCALCSWTQIHDSSISGVALEPWLVFALFDQLSLTGDQTQRLQRATIVMLEVAQGAGAIYSNPANFGTSLGIQIVGAKVILSYPSVSHSLS